MELGLPDPRDIPILTDAVKQDAKANITVNSEALRAAVLAETLELTHSLLQQAAKDIEACLIERVLERLRSQLPELLERIVREHTAPHG